MKKFLSLILVLALVLSVSSVALAANGTISGAGTETDPYLIEDLADLEAFRNAVNAGNNYAGKYVQLAASIDMSSVDSWTPIGNIDYDSKYKPSDASRVFSGVFDGNGKVLSNLKIEKKLEYSASDTMYDKQANLGLFGIIGEGAVIKDLTITNVDIYTNGRNVGALAGVTYGSIANITVNGNIQIVGGNNVSGVGGMNRYHAVSATNVTLSGNAGSAIIGNNIVGGIFAEIAPNGEVHTFENLSVENVSITGVGGVGGIVGLLSDGAISNVSVKNVALTGRTDYLGDPMGRIRLGSVAGILGGTSVTVSNIVAIENVTAKNLDGKDVELPDVGANYDAEINGISTNATEARIGDKYYATLAIAVDKANDGDTVVLLTDIELKGNGINVPAGKKFTLDLNGKTLSGVTEAAGTSAVIKNYGDLTVMDSGEGGKITAFAKNPDTAGIPSYANNTISNYGTFTLKSGTIENSTGDEARACFPIDNYSKNSDAIVNIEGGKVTGRGAIRQYAESTTYENTVNITGGIVEGTSYGLWAQNPSGGNPKAHLNIEGGTVSRVLLSTSSGFTGSITGGNIDKVEFWEPDTTDPSRNMSGFISGGIFNAEPADDLIVDGAIAAEVTDASGKTVYTIGEEATKEAAIPGSTVKVTNGSVELDGTTVSEGDDPYVVPEEEDEPTAPAKPRDSIKVTYNGGNSFSTSKSAVPTSVEIDGVSVPFNGDGKYFTVGCIDADAKWVTVRWNSTSVTVNFTPDVQSFCAEIGIPKTGDMPLWAAIAEFLGF